MSEKLRVFVASSSEQVEVAHAVAKALRGAPGLDVGVWEEDVFECTAARRRKSGR